MPPAPDGPVCFAITRPPSTNALYSNASGARIRHRDGKRITPGRVKTAAYRKWIDLAGWEMKEQYHPLPIFVGCVAVSIESVVGIDLDNIKAIPDLLTSMGVIADDSLIEDLHIKRRGKLVDKVLVTIWMA